MEDSFIKRVSWEVFGSASETAVCDIIERHVQASSVSYSRSLFMTRRKSRYVQATRGCSRSRKEPVTNTFNSVFDHCYGFTTAKIHPHVRAMPRGIAAGVAMYLPESLEIPFTLRDPRDNYNSLQLWRNEMPLTHTLSMNIPNYLILNSLIPTTEKFMAW
jgi:hypothetical protein